MLTPPRTATTVIVSMFTVMVAACSSSEGGEPVPPQESETAPAPSTSAAGATSADQKSASLSSIDPCSLLSSNELSKYGTFPPGVPNNVGSARGCKYEKDTDSPTTDPNRVISVNLRNEQGIDDVQDLGNGINRTEVDGREYAQVAASGGCIIVIGVSPTSRVDINTTATEGTQKRCNIADEVGQIVEPKLPQG